MKDNPFLKLDNPYEDVEKQTQHAAEYEKEFERLCWSVWHQSPDGKALYERLKERYLLRTQINPLSQTAATEAIWWDGFKSAISGLYYLGRQHILRVNTPQPEVRIPEHE